MSKWIPDRKLWGGGLTAVIAWLIVQAVQAYTGRVLPPGTDEKLAFVIGLVAAYALPPSARDILRHIDEDIVKKIAADPKIPLVKAAEPPPATTTVINGMTGRPLSIMVMMMLLLPALGACGSIRTVESAAPTVTSAPITQAVQTVKEMPAEEKWRLTCLAIDGLYIGYVTAAAPRLSDATNLKVQGAHEAVKVICANKPTDYVSAIPTLIGAFNAFMAAMPAKAGA